MSDNDITYDVVDVDQQLTESEPLDIVDRHDGVIAGDEFTRAVIESAQKLQVISKWGVGIDAINTDAAEDHGVEVYNTPGTFDDEVADVVMGYAVVLTRKLHYTDRDIRDGNWTTPRGTSLLGKTFGVVRVGNIGSAIAQ